MKAQESAAPARAKLAEIPERFFQVQDELGFFWQAASNGALTSGETQYLQSGLNLLVDGDVFAPAEAWARESDELRLIETRPALTITRDLVFDRQRSAVRILDTIANRGNAEARVAVVLRTTYPFAWQSLHGTGGGLLGSDADLRLGERDYSLGVRFNRAEGRHDTFFIVSSEKGALKPGLAASANARELSFSYELSIPPGDSRSLLHWVMQRNLPDAGEDLPALAAFVQRDRLVQPGLTEAEAAKVVNFAPGAFQAETSVPANLRGLLALNGVLDAIGMARRSDDVHWISATNQVSGAMARDRVLTIDLPSGGEREVAVGELAAIRGGTAAGQGGLFYLRDGRVFSGTLASGELLWTPAGGAAGAAEARPLPLDEVNLLLFSVGPGDGTPPATATHFLQLADGSTHAVKDESGAWDWIAPWGRTTLPWDELVEAGRAASGASWRVVRADGSSWSAMLPQARVTFATVSDEAMEVNAASVRRIWRAGAAQLVIPGFSDRWLDFPEIPSGLAPAEGFLLAGNQLLAGSFAEETLLFADGGRKIPVESAGVVALRRPADGGDTRFEVELSGGEKLVAEWPAAYFRLLLADGGEIDLPVSRLRAYRQGSR